MEMLDAESLAWLKEETSRSVEVIHEDARTLTKAFREGAPGDVAVKEFAKLPPARNHSFSSLEGFVGFLNSDACADDRGVVFVGQERVSASLRYADAQQEIVLLPLEASAELRALTDALAVGVKNAELDRLLKTDLHGCLPVELMVQVANLRRVETVKADAEIAASGMIDAVTGRTVRVTYQDTRNGATHEQELQLDWTFTGRIWECFDRMYSVELTVQIEKDGWVYKFFPRRLEDTLRDARADLVAHLEKHIDPERFSVYEGTL